jgi:hypothetical protein
MCAREKLVMMMAEQKQQEGKNPWRCIQCGTAGEGCLCRECRARALSQKGE